MSGRIRCLAKICAVLICIGGALSAKAEPVRAWQGTLTIPTYKLGPADPNPSFPIVNPQGVYPYTMLDDVTSEREPQAYKALYLENQYLKIIVLPQLGGHVYSIFDKVHHREVLYRNHVVKYGLVGPRGAWIAGGMEFSFPYAHSMDTVSPIESTIRRAGDGSATVVVGAIDWVTNMYWEIALTLQPDAATLREDVTLFNATPQQNLYLFWTNAAVKATAGLEYIYPMRETISDDPFAIVQAWPVWNGVDQSWYKNVSEAMAIFGRDVHRNFFGVYDHQSDFGVVHVADFRQDPGKKIWTWGTARSGRIWDKLLSDEDGPYNEIQSGRFPTQGYREFMPPRRVEKWTEYWYPVAGLKGGFVEATSQVAINVTFPAGHDVEVTISPAAEVKGATILIKQGGKILKAVRTVDLLPLHSESISVPVPDVDAVKHKLAIEVTSAAGERILDWSANEPVDGNPDFVARAGTPSQSEIPDSLQTPIQALYLRGVFLQKSGDLKGALEVYDEVLHRDPDYIPALLREAWYHYQAGSFAQAEQQIARAVHRDETNPEVQYVSGVVDRAEGRFDLAKDGFWTSIHYGGAPAPALVELGEIEIRVKNYSKAAELLRQAVSFNPGDAFALADLSVAERLAGNLEESAAAADKAVDEMPLLPYALAEQFERQQDRVANVAAYQISNRVSNQVGNQASGSHWKQMLQSDPQNYVAIAAWYHSLGAWKSADLVLKVAANDAAASTIFPMVNYYLASDARQEGDAQAADQYARQAASSKAVAVFPNRLEDESVLLEALEATPVDAQAKYELGNFLFAHDRYEEAAGLWKKAMDEGFNNAVIARNVGLFDWHIKHDLAEAGEEYARAIALSPGEYRLYSDLDEIYEQEDNISARDELFQQAPRPVLDHDSVRARYVLFLTETKRYKEALAELATHHFTPWEGGVSIYNLYVVANMQSGEQALSDHQFAEAEKYFREAMRYPENLGTGEPSAPPLLEQLYWLGNALEAENQQQNAKTAWERVASEGKTGSESCELFSALALEKLGEQSSARDLLQTCIADAEQPGASAGAFFQAGMAEQNIGHAQRARADFRRALIVDPLYWRARIALSATE